MPVSIKTVRFPSSAITLGVGIVSLIALSLAVTTWLDVASAHSRFNKQIETRGQLIVDSAAEFARDAVYFRDIDRLKDVGKVVSSQPGVSYVEFVDEEGRSFLGIGNYEINASDTAAYVFERTIAPQGQVVGYIRVGLDDDELKSELNAITRKGIWQGLILFGTGTTLAIVLGLVFARPLSRAASAARQLADGDLSTRLDLAGTSEMRALGSAFNRMASQIEENEHSLKKEQEKLENRVSERTEELLSIARIGRLISSGLDVRQIFSDFGRQFNTLVEHDSLALYEHDSEAAQLKHVSSEQGLDWPERMALPGIWKDIEHVRLEVRQFSGQGGHDQLFDDETFGSVMAANVAVPLMSNQQMIGVLIVSRTSSEFDFEAIDRCRRIGVHIAGALATSLLYERNMVMASERQRTLEEDSERLKAADQAKDEFLSSLSHELRTPLVPILGYASLLVSKLSDQLDAEDVEKLNTIERNGKRLNSQIEDLLDLSRVQTKRLEINPVWVEWREFLADVELSMKPLLSTSGHRLMIDVRHEDLWVNIDPARMNQVVSNLISNAAKYSPGAGSIEMVSEISAGKLALSVHDKGIGIKPEDLKHLFTLFYRTQDAITSAAPGTGIGLFVSKKIVDLHKGSLGIKSQYGKGSVATLTLAATNEVPVAEKHAHPLLENRLDELSA